jgi:hypothetical protein
MPQFAFLMFSTERNSKKHRRFSIFRPQKIKTIRIAIFNVRKTEKKHAKTRENGAKTQFFAQNLRRYPNLQNLKNGCKLLQLQLAA